MALDASHRVGPTGCVKRDDVVADLDVVHVLANTLDDTTALVPQDDGEGALGVLS
jgi:hypothetical protein